MKQKSLLLFYLFVVCSAMADPFGTAFSGNANTYFRVVLEKRNGIDMRANVIPQAVIDQLESQGKTVRPSRSSANVGYWAFLANGDFVTMEVMNNPSSENLGYAQLDSIFAKAPRNGTKWKKGRDLDIAGRSYSIRILDADDPATGGRKGELEVAVLVDGRKRYFYFGELLTKPV